MKVAWLAVVSLSSRLGYTVETWPDERQAWNNWAKRRSQKIVGEFPSRQQASTAVAEWLNRPRVFES